MDGLIWLAARAKYAARWRSMPQVALAWVVSRLDLSSVLIGASRISQIEEDIASFDIILSPEHQDCLNAASALPLLNPYYIFDLPCDRIFGGHKMEAWGSASG